MKATLIFRFAGLIQWPGHSTVLDKKSPFVIGILGNTSITSSLIEAATTQRVRGKQVTIIPIPNSDHPDIKKCNVLFISEFSRKKFRDIMQTIAELPILTIGDTKDYEKRGVMINLFNSSEKRLKFNVNCLAARRSGIQLTSKVVQYAKDIIK
ncbi:MAG: YfiR family protein [bacterium]|nr:YfiR family protein [bacterium]